MEAVVVDEPQIVVFKGSFKLAAEPRGVARSAALAAAEMVLVSLCDCNPLSPLAGSHVSLSESVASQDQDCIAACCKYRTPAQWWQGVSRLALLTAVLHGKVVNAPRRHTCMMCCNHSRL